MEHFIGQICMFPYGWAPRGWTECNGQILAITQHQALFSLIGTTYGGDGRTTFALPDLRGKKARNGRRVKYYICLQGIYPSRH